MPAAVAAGCVSLGVGAVVVTSVVAAEPRRKYHHADSLSRMRNRRSPAGSALARRPQGAGPREPDSRAREGCAPARAAGGGAGGDAAPALDAARRAAHDDLPDARKSRGARPRRARYAARLLPPRLEA